jgi:hypothetical protein
MNNGFAADPASSDPPQRQRPAAALTYGAPSDAIVLDDAWLTSHYPPRSASVGSDAVQLGNLNLQNPYRQDPFRPSPHAAAPAPAPAAPPPADDGARSSRREQTDLEARSEMIAANVALLRASMSAAHGEEVENVRAQLRAEAEERARLQQLLRQYEMASRGPPRADARAHAHAAAELEVEDPTAAPEPIAQAKRDHEALELQREAAATAAAASRLEEAMAVAQSRVRLICHIVPGRAIDSVEIRHIVPGLAAGTRRRRQGQGAERGRRDREDAGACSRAAGGDACGGPCRSGAAHERMPPIRKKPARHWPVGRTRARRITFAHGVACVRTRVRAFMHAHACVRLRACVSAPARARARLGQK